MNLEATADIETGTSCTWSLKAKGLWSAGCKATKDDVGRTDKTAATNYTVHFCCSHMVGLLRHGMDETSSRSG